MNRIFTLFAALLLVSAGVVSAQDYVIKMRTAHAVGEWVGFSIQCNGDTVDIIGAVPDPSDGSFQVTSQEIELRGKITRLDCSSNQLVSLDVSGNPLLVELYADNNQLTDITFGNQPNLKALYVGDNLFTSLDLTGLSELSTLSCYKNNLTSIDLSKTPKLTELICRENRLEGTLDLTPVPLLQWVSCFNNSLSAIKLAPDSHMGKMEIERNSIGEQEMTALVNSLPQYQAIDEYYDWYGMDPQAFLPFEWDSDLEENVFTPQHLAVLKSKGWPVYAVDNVDVFDDLKEIDDTLAGIGGVQDAGRSSNGSPAYDLTGRAVQPERARGGIYIMRSGDKVRKVLRK